MISINSQQFASLKSQNIPSDLDPCFLGDINFMKENYGIATIAVYKFGDEYQADVLELDELTDLEIDDIRTQATIIELV